MKIIKHKQHFTDISIGIVLRTNCIKCCIFKINIYFLFLLYYIVFAETQVPYFTCIYCRSSYIT